MPEFFGMDEVTVVEDFGDGKVTLTYAPDAGGKSLKETMAKEEWENGKSDKGLDQPLERQEWFVKRTTAMRAKIARAFFGDNPRYWEIPKIVLWVQEGIKDAFEKAVSCAFGVENFEEHVTVATIVEESPIDVSDLNDIEKAILDVVVKGEVKVWEVKTGHLFDRVLFKLKESVDQAVVKRMGVDNSHMRTDDIENFLKAYEQAKASEGSHTDGGEKSEDVGNKSTGEGSSPSEDPNGAEEAAA